VVARRRQASGADQVDRLVEVLGDTARTIIAGELDMQATEAAARLLGLSPELAAEHVALLHDPLRGLIPDGAVDEAALTTLVDLRRRFLPVPELAEISADEVIRARRT